MRGDLGLSFYSLSDDDVSSLLKDVLASTPPSQREIRSLSGVEGSFSFYKPSH